MKALVVRQPWAWAIAAGYKPVENRSYRTSYRGPLAIVAGKSPSDLQDGGSVWIREKMGIDMPYELPAGKIVAVCDLVDCFPWPSIFPPGSCPLAPGSSAWLTGPYCWQLASVRPLFENPIPCRGMPGLFDLPDAITEQLNQQLAGK